MGVLKRRPTFKREGKGGEGKERWRGGEELRPSSVVAH